MALEGNSARQSAINALVERDEVAHWLEDLAQRVRRGEVREFKVSWALGDMKLVATEKPEAPMTYMATMIKLERGE